jgi:ubiquinone/menaquinone biosynthesis C-methylase UbiE
MGEVVVVRTPIDVPTRATVAFIASHLPPGASVLEVGCGEGRVALELLSRGYQVIGVDSDQEVIARAQERGVPAIQASWPEFESAPLGGVVFTRSLHHIAQLWKAIRHAREVLRPRGMLLVEDFAFDEADKATISWFLEALGSQTARAIITRVPGEFVTDLLGSKDPFAVWHQSHDHQLHTTAAMTQAIRALHHSGNSAGSISLSLPCSGITRDRPGDGVRRGGRPGGGAPWRTWSDRASWPPHRRRTTRSEHHLTPPGAAH